MRSSARPSPGRRADMGVRKDYRDLTADERDRFVRALRHVKSTGLIDRFAQMHARHFSMGIHRSSHFLPWHREMIRRFEHQLHDFDHAITLPYWNSSVDRGTDAALWNNGFMGQFNADWNLRRALGASGTLPTPEQVRKNRRLNRYDDFWPRLERRIHNPPHVWVGGEMSQADSPHDPVFYLHHCWIDSLWVRWQLKHPRAPFVSSGPGFGLHAPLMEW